MNERIKLLAEQAGFSFKYKTAPDEMNPGHKLKDLKKFAELIVMECLTICEDLGDQGLDGHYCADKINKTFRPELKNE